MCQTQITTSSEIFVEINTNKRYFHKTRNHGSFPVSSKYTLTPEVQFSNILLQLKGNLFLKKSLLLENFKPRGCYFIAEGEYILLYLILFCNYRNLKRLVHAMILKRPPGEWLGIIRFEFALWLK